MDSRQMLEELGRYVVADPYPFVLDLERSSGMWLATRDGRRLFDWAGYYGAKLIGHNHPALYAPDYLHRLAVAANNKIANPDFLTGECLDYYRLIHSLAPHRMRNDRLEVYVVNSGAEAVENMLKYMINLHVQQHGGNARRFIYFDQAFHGRTVFALNVTDLRHSPVITRDFRGLADGNTQIAFPAVNADAPAAENDRRTDEALAAVEAALRSDPGGIAGIVVEPLQGAGGHRMAQPRFFQELSRLAHSHGVGLGFDEVQTAGGQTGTVFAIDQLDLPYPPSAVATAKKMACGVVYMLYPMDDHGVLDSTWGGSLADMVRFVREWSIVQEERLLEQVPAKSEAMVRMLHCCAAAVPGMVRDIRGMGLYQGFSMPAAAPTQALVDDALTTEELLLLKAGPTSVRLRPNLSVTLEEIDLLGEKLTRCLRRVAGTRQGMEA
ncbi:MAG: aminotransferase class III-fold pyridoxal phosphate-dependent enzyme [Armatimonadetes bacterium]|nr:aminotransferase class III-fold pyridoxal phosphate-dependent enzyme [Armatimonadota bacterium]